MHLSVEQMMSHLLFLDASKIQNENAKTDESYSQPTHPDLGALNTQRALRGRDKSWFWDSTLTLSLLVCVALSRADFPKGRGVPQIC